MYEQFKDKSGSALCFNNIGLNFYKQRNFSAALENYSKSLSIHRELNNKSGIAVVLNNMGTVYFEQGDLKKALDLYKEGIELYKELGDKSGVAWSMNNVGMILKTEKKYKDAEAYLIESLKLSKEVGYPESIVNASSNLYELYKMQNKSALALEMHELYTQMKDSINNQETRKASVRKQMQYEFEKKQAELKAGQEKREIAHQAEAKKQRIILISVAAGLMLVLGFAFYILRTLRITREQKTIIEEQKHLVEMKQSEILDSIRYAKRIQSALVTSEYYINKELKRLHGRKL